MSKLAARGTTIDVWKTPQIAAIEWLIGERLSLPDEFDPVFHDLFFRILGFYLHLDALPNRTEMKEAAKTAQRAISELRGIVDEINAASPDLLKFFDFSTAGADTLRALQAWEQVEVFANGYCGIEHIVTEKFDGTTADRASGRPVSWEALLVTMYAADVYLTFTGHVPAPRSGGKSFESFLGRFFRGIRSVEKKDMRRLARALRDADYRPARIGRGAYLPQIS